MRVGGHVATAAASCFFMFWPPAADGAETWFAVFAVFAVFF
jgi:hypothetical protein